MKNKELIIAALVAVTVGTATAVVVTNSIFKYETYSECVDYMEGDERSCKCFARVVSSRISFFGKWKLILLRDVAPVEVMKNVPFMELATCGLM